MSKDAESLIDMYFILHIGSVILVLFLFIFSSYYGYFYGQHISYTPKDFLGAPYKPILGSHYFGDFQEIMRNGYEFSNLGGYAQNQWIDSPPTLALGAFFSFLAKLTNRQYSYILFIVIPLILIFVALFRLIQPFKRRVLIYFCILSSVGTISGVDRGNSWLLCTALLFIASALEWKGASKLLIVVSASIKPPLLLFALILFLRERRLKPFLGTIVLFLVANLLSLALLIRSIAPRVLFDELLNWVSILRESNFNRSFQGNSILASGNGLSPNFLSSFTFLEPYLPKGSLFLLTAFLQIFFCTALIGNVFLIRYTNLPVDFFLLGVSIIIAFFVQATPYTLALFCLFIPKIPTFTRCYEEDEVLPWWILLLFVNSPIVLKLHDRIVISALLVPLFYCFKTNHLLFIYLKNRYFQNSKGNLKC